jgi:hypothetical protein
MALIIWGRTRCSGCGETLMNGDVIESFTAFVANELDPLYRFNDVAYHLRCLEQQPLGGAALDRMHAVIARVGPGHRACVVCHEQIVDPDDYFGTGFLTGDSGVAANEFNFVQFHVSHFLGWNRAIEFREAMEALFASGSWVGPKIVFDPLPRWVP